MNFHLYLNMNKKKGNILVGNVVYIVLVLAFFAILFIFIANKSSATSLVEERTAKQVALMIDSAEPGTRITLNLNSVLDKREDGREVDDVIIITDNFVRVQLSDKSFYVYSFFNNVKVSYKIEGGFLTLDIR